MSLHSHLHKYNLTPFLKSILVFFILSLGILPLNAINIRGRVIDPEDNSGISGAECQLRLYESILSQVLSGEDGNFEFSVDIEPTDSISLSIIFPGYERYDSTLTDLKQDTNIGNCPLPLTTMLSDLVVEGENVRRVGANILMTPMESQINNSIRANDLLNNMAIPGLRMSPENGDISMPGHDLVIMVNGIPADQTQIKAIPADEIVSIEYSPIVPPAFSNLGNFMINIRTKRHESGGSLSVNEMVGLLFPENTTNLSLSLNKGASRFKLDGFFHYRDFRHVSYIRKQSFRAPDKDFTVDSEISQPYHAKVPQATLEYTYNPDENLLFMARGNLNGRYYKMNNYATVDDSSLGEYSSHEKIRDRYWTPSLEAYLSKTFKSRSTIELDMVGTYSTDNYAYSNSYSGGIAIPEVGNITDSRRYSLISTAGYNYKFSDKTQLSLTWQNLSSHTHNKYPTTNDSYSMNENNNSFILYLQQTVGKIWIGAKPGLKYSILKDPSERRSFVYPTGDLLVTWAPSGHFNLMWQTKYFVQDLTLSSLVPTPLWDSNYLYSIGNPDLKMQKNLSNLLMLNYTLGNLRTYFTGSYIRYYDVIYTDFEYDAATSAFRESYVNGNPANGVSLRLGGGYYNFLNMFSLQGEIQFRRLSMNHNDYSFRHSSVGGYVILSWRYKKYGLTYQQVFPSANMDINLIDKDSPLSVFIAEYRPDNHWTLQLSGVVYNKRPMYKTTSWSRAYSLDFTRDFLKDTNTIRLSIAYDLSWGRKYNSTRSKSIDVSDENNAVAKKAN